MQDACRLSVIRGTGKLRDIRRLPVRLTLKQKWKTQKHLTAGFILGRSTKLVFGSECSGSRLAQSLKSGVPYVGHVCFQHKHNANFASKLALNTACRKTPYFRKWVSEIAEIEAGEVLNIKKFTYVNDCF